MTDKKQEPLPCPRCGSRLEQFHSYNAYRCDKCSVNGGWLSLEDSNRRTPAPAREDLATREIIGKAEAAINLCRAYLADIYEDQPMDTLMQSHYNHLTIAAGALNRLLAISPPSKSEDGVRELRELCPRHRRVGKDAQRGHLCACEAIHQAHTIGSRDPISKFSEDEVRAEVWEEAAKIAEEAWTSTQTRVAPFDVMLAKAKALRAGEARTVCQGINCAHDAECAGWYDVPQPPPSQSECKDWHCRPGKLCGECAKKPTPEPREKGG